MSGMPGRTGVPRSPEALQARTAASVRGREKKRAEREAKERASSRAPIDHDIDPMIARAALAASPNIPEPRSWRESHQQQQTGVEALKREKLEIEIATLRRERRPVSEFQEYLIRLREAMMSEMSMLAQLAEKIPDSRPYQIEAMRTALLDFISSYRTAITKIKL